MRKATAALAILLLLIVLAIVLVPRLVSIESLKPRIVATLEEKTGRRISLDRISLSLFPGIGVRISGLSVSGDDRHPEEHLLEVPEGEVRLAIGPLFSGRAEFTKFVLRRPKILFRKYADGTHSATQIAARLARKEKAPERPAPPAAEEKVSVMLRSVSIEEADLSLRTEEPGGRETRWDISPFTFRLGGLGGRKNEFEIETRIAGAVQGEISFAGTATHEGGAVSDPARFDLTGRGKLFGQKIEVTGKMSAPAGPPEVDLTIALPGIEMGALPSLLRDPPRPLREARLEGIAGLVLKVAGTLQSMGFEAEADLTRAGWTLSRDPEVRKYIDTPCTLLLQGHWFPDLLVISNAELSTPPLLLIGNASAVPSTGEREWSVSSRVASLEEFGKIRGGGLDAFAPSGRLTVSGRGKRVRHGAGERYRVAADLGEVGWRIPGRGMEFRSLNGHVEITPARVKFEPLAGLFNGQRFTLRGNATLGAAPSGEVSLRMAYLDADALFPSKREEPKEPATPRGNGTGKTPGKDGAARDFSVRVNLAIDAGTAYGLEFRDLAGTARYERKTLFLDAARAKMYGGEVSVTGTVGFGDPSPAFRAKFHLKNVEAGEILSRKTALGKLVTGPVTLTGNLAGATGDFSEFARTASGGGSFRVRGGTIKGVDLLRSAVGLAGLSNLLPATESKGGGQEKQTPFKELSADFRIAGGKIESDALRIVSDRMGLDGEASLGFDRTIEFRGILRLPKALAGRAGGTTGKFLTGADGGVEIPLVVSGPVTGPAIAIDAETLSKGLAQGMLRGITERLLSPPGPVPADNTDGTGGDGGGKKPSPGKELEGLFRKIFPGSR
ncbi:MAG: hypothetical protein Kow00128_22620 [Deltaproteobacteria bacterium]